jgi:hypothetical protein
MESPAFSFVAESVWATIESGLLKDNTHQSTIKQTGFLQIFPSVFPLKRF